MTVSVHVVGGFLGAGKTTTLLHLIEQLAADERVAVVVNDFGESAIDQQIVGERGLALQEIRGACVCCTAPEGFLGSVRALIDEVAPTRILVEPTGLARPADLLDTLRRAPWSDEITLGPLVVVVDPHVLATRGELGAQASSADILVVNRTDLASPDELERLDRWLGDLWPGPLAVYRTTHGRVPREVLQWPEGEGPRRPAQAAPEAAHVHDHGVHGHTARTWVWGPDHVLHRGRLTAALQALADDPGVARLKGVARTEEGVERFEIAGGRVHTAPSDWRRDSRFDAIVGEPALLDAIALRLQQAALRPEEAAASGERVEVALPDGRRRIFDRAALAALPRQIADVAELVPGRRGAAVRLSEVLRAVGEFEAGARAVVVAVDGYATPPVPASALDAAVLLHSLDGGPLPPDKGGPFRLLIPGDAGPGGPCANVKGVARIALRPPG